MKANTQIVSGDVCPAQSVLEWLPDETLFSLVSRLHMLSGRALPAESSRLFFGAARRGSQHDLPGYLGEFASRTSGVLGDADNLARVRTLLVYYMAFMSYEETQNTIAFMTGGSIAHLKLRLGVLTSRFRAHHPLKACPECMRSDSSTYGWSYWHLQHQFPGVWMCSMHGVPLQESILKSTGVERFSWHLPELNSLRFEEPWQAQVVADPSHPIRKFSELVVQIVEQGKSCPLDATRLLQVYRQELQNRQWLTPNGSLRMPEIAGSFVAHCNRLRIVPELRALPASFNDAKTQLGRLLRPLRSGTHPLRHLVLIHWLFGTSEAFWRAYAEEANAKEVARKTLQRNEDTRPPSVEDPRHAELIELIGAESLSHRQAAKRLGVDVGTALTWAGQAGLRVNRRPKKLKPNIRRAAIAALRKGCNKSDVAQLAGVSIVTITKLLLSEADLHAAWQDARFKKSQLKARKDWMRLLHQHGAIGIKYMRSIAPATYAWLYRNDRSWLGENTPLPISRAAIPLAPPIAWDERDLALSAQVDRAALSLHQKNHSSIRLWQIYQLVPDLKSKLSVLDRLPLTKQAIDRALNHAKASHRGQQLFS